jgi:hypothetical protein
LVYCGAKVVHLLEASSLAYGWIWFGKLGFDLASCGIGKEISALIDIFFLFHAILVRNPRRSISAYTLHQFSSHLLVDKSFFARLLGVQGRTPS